MIVNKDNNHDSPEQDAVDCSNGNYVVRHLRQAIAGGENWYIALLQAVRMWTMPE